IAILDTGIDDTHPALDDMNDDGDVVSDPKVVDLVDFTDDGDGFDYVGHGTHCAGISAGTAAGTAYEGMAPGAWLWNVKVLDHTGSGWESWIIDGIQYASLGPDGTTGTGDEADIISMSLGSQTASVGDDPEGRAVKAAVEAGVVVVISAGNSGNDGVDDAYTIGRPGLTEEVITVGALNEAFNGVVDFSSRGPTLDERIKPDILAPGEAIMSSVPYGEHYDITYGDKVADGYAPLDGTSMACPHVAGAAALLLQQAAGSFPGTLPAPQFVKNALLCSAEDLGLGVFHQGVGRLDMTACWGADGAPDVMLAPANQYLGDYDISAPTAAGSLTFYAGDTARNLTLTGTLVKAATGEATASSINFTGGNTV
ncbi:MAG: S8 family serine peptidase, partial [Deltaproteobacteria bacterium]|nr:S8 family serine peptidase [Candidatus Anaeroferrophillacea bacterium]